MSRILDVTVYLNLSAAFEITDQGRDALYYRKIYLSSNGSGVV